jgi:hypothetical protein
MQHRVSAFAWLIMAGCSVGAPPGFSGGDHWTFPLVGPLEDGLLVTLASVHGHGPYLFAIDPDANVTAVDKGVVEEAGLRTGIGPRRIDETDTGQPRFYAELLDFKIAGLTIERRDAMVFPIGFYDAEGRHIRGVLGRDAIADSMVFGFDRDQGIATLSTAKAFKAPPDAIPIRYESLSSASSEFVTNVDRQQAAAQGEGQLGMPASSVNPPPRRLATAQIGRATFAMHLDLGAATGQLLESRWDRAHLAPVDARFHLVDEAATARDFARAGVASEVTVAGARTFNVTFAPYVDKRFGENVDGTLGLDFFRPYAVYANWDRKTFFLRLRGDLAATATARLGRWGAAIPACPHPGCVTAALASGGSGVAIDVTRDAEAAHRALEVFLGVTPAVGKTAAPLVVELPDGVDRITTPLPEDYAGATLAVLDAAPFLRGCPGNGGCVLQVGASSTHKEAPPGGAPPGAAPPGAAPPGDSAPGAADIGEPAAPPAPVRMVAPDKLHRLTGDPAIPPSDDVKRAAGGKPFAAAIVKLCLDPGGKVASTRLVKSSGVPAYDDQIQAVMKETWTFSPGEVDGRPVAVCTAVTFLKR